MTTSARRPLARIGGPDFGKSSHDDFREVRGTSFHDNLLRFSNCEVLDAVGCATPTCTFAVLRGTRPLSAGPFGRGEHRSVSQRRAHGHTAGTSEWSAFAVGSCRVRALRVRALLPLRPAFSKQEFVARGGLRVRALRPLRPAFSKQVRWGWGGRANVPAFQRQRSRLRLENRVMTTSAGVRWPE